MFPIMLACNTGALGGFVLMIASVGAMGIGGLIAAIVFAVRLSCGREFSTAGVIARIVTYAALLAPGLFVGIKMLA